jgi:hypothetical protein
MLPHMGKLFFPTPTLVACNKQVNFLIAFVFVEDIMSVIHSTCCLSTVNCSLHYVGNLPLHLCSFKATHSNVWRKTIYCHKFSNIVRISKRFHAAEIYRSQ